MEERKSEEMMFFDLGEEESDVKSTSVVKPVTFTIDDGSSRLEGFKPSSRKRKGTTLRCHKLINGLQGAKTVHKAKTMEDRRNATLNLWKKKYEVESKKKNLLPRLLKQRKIHASSIKKPVVPKISNSMTVDWTKDGWDVEDKLIKQCKDNGVDEDFVEQIVGFHSKITGEYNFNIPACRYQKTSLLPAVILPDPGQSYNPLYEDHQIVLQKAVKQELKQRRIQKQIDRVTTDMFPTIDEAPTEQTWLNEMSEGLPKVEGSESEEEDEEEASESKVTVSGKRTTERKTRKQKKREKRRKFKENRKAAAKERRINENDVFRIKSLKKEIVASENMLKHRQAARKSYYEQKKTKPHRLGSVRYEAEQIAVNTGDELKGSVRLAKPAVNLLEERFKNYQRRNIIEPRKSVRHKKPKREKTVMKREHKAALEEIEKDAMDMMKKE